MFRPLLMTWVGLALQPASPVLALSAAVRVYLDTDGDGLHDEDESGVPQVMVSDGDRVTRTDDSGLARFDVPEAPGEVRRVFVVVPGGYRATTPWHRLLEPGVDDEQPCLFGLEAATEPDTLGFAVTGDTHALVEDADRLAAGLLSELAPPHDRPTFIALLGDGTEHGLPEELLAWRDALAASPVPVYLLFGPHDAGPPERPDSAAFERVCGPAWYAFWRGGCCFIVLVSEPEILTGRQQARQLRWLRRLLVGLPEQSPVVLLGHVPPAAPELAQVQARHRLRAVFYAHWHENSVWWLGEVPMICTGPYRGIEWGVGTGSFRRVELTAEGLSTKLVTSGVRQRLDVLSPSVLQPPDRLQVPLRVVADDSRTEVVRVEAQVGDTPPQPLRHAGGGVWRLDLPGERLDRLVVRVCDDAGLTWERAVEVPAARRPPELDLTPGSPPPEPPLARAWLASTGLPRLDTGGVVVAGARLLVGLPDDDVPSRAGLVCLDAKTGRELWRRPTRGSVRRDPVVLGDRVYALTHLNQVHAFELGNGREVWRRELTPEPPGRHRNSHSGLTAWRGGLLVQVSGGPLVLLDAATGATARKLAVGGAFCTVPAALGDKAVLATLTELVGIDLTTFEAVWRTAPPGGLERHGPVTLDGDLGFVLGPELHAFELGSGRLRWSEPVASSGLNLGAVTVADGVAFTPGPRPLAFRTATGVALWPGAKARPAARPGAVAVGRRYLWATSDDGELAAYDRASGAEVWRASLGVPVKSSPVIEGGALYVLDAAGNVHAFGTAGTGL